jgi:hypothetical protein
MGKIQARKNLTGATMFSLAEFTAHDGLPEADRARYNQLTASLEANLRPSGYLEIFLAAEILRATWRIQRLTGVNSADLADDTARAELERSTASARKSLRWGMSELRKLQTDREIKQQLGINMPGIADVRQILRLTGGQFKATTAATAAPAAPKPAKAPTEAAIIANMEAIFQSRIEGESSKLSTAVAEIENLKIRTHLTPRNAPCPCGSGEKHKRCCGKDAPAVPGDWKRTLTTAA